MLETKYLDPDYRRDSKTNLFCVRCQKDLKPEGNYRSVHLIDGGLTVLHPNSEIEYQPDNGDLGAHPIGNSCAKQIGLEWTHK